MRSRTELVTTNLAESENEDDPSMDDSEEDWKPAKKSGRGGSKVAPKSAPKRKSAGGAGKRAVAKKSKKEESEDSEEEPEDEEDVEDEEEDDDEEDDSDDGSKGRKYENKSAKRSRSNVNVGKNQPDKDGNMELYLFKNDLTKDFRTDAKLCMWRRDGASLLQKYILVKPEPNSKDLIFNASSVYSCWEEKRKNDFFQIKVKLIGDKKDGKVKVVDIDELEKFALEDRPKIDLTPKGAERGPNEAEDDEEGDEEEDGEEGEGLDDIEEEE